MTDIPTTIKCACGDPNCKIKITFGFAKELWITDKDGNETLMYVNEHILRQLVLNARNKLYQDELWRGQ